MANQLIPFSKVAKDFSDMLTELTPAEQAMAVYMTQISVGKFPRDLEEERRLKAALKAESP